MVPTAPFGPVLENALKHDVQGGRLAAIKDRIVYPNFYCCRSGTTVGVAKDPVAIMSVNPLTQCVGLNVTVDYSNSYSPSSTLASYEVNWGDGSTTGQQAWPGPGSVVHQYTLPGTYTITLTVTDILGAYGQDTQQVVIVDCSLIPFIGYAGCGSSGVWYTEDGVNWENRGGGVLDGVLVYDVKASPFTFNLEQMELWAATENGLYKTTNSGMSWERLTLPEPQEGWGEPVAASVRPSTLETDTVYVLAYVVTPPRTYLYATYDGGQEWDWIALGAVAGNLDWDTSGIGSGIAPHHLVEAFGRLHAIGPPVAGIEDVYRRDGANNWNVIPRAIDQGVGCLGWSYDAGLGIEYLEAGGDGLVDGFDCIRASYRQLYSYGCGQTAQLSPCGVRDISFRGRVLWNHWYTYPPVHPEDRIHDPYGEEKVKVYENRWSNLVIHGVYSDDTSVFVAEWYQGALPWEGRIRRYQMNHPWLGHVWLLEDLRDNHWVVDWAFLDGLPPHGDLRSTIYAALYNLDYLVYRVPGECIEPCAGSWVDDTYLGSRVTTPNGSPITAVWTTASSQITMANYLYIGAGDTIYRRDYGGIYAPVCIVPGTISDIVLFNGEWYAAVAGAGVNPNGVYRCGGMVSSVSDIGRTHLIDEDPSGLYVYVCILDEHNNPVIVRVSSGLAAQDILYQPGAGTWGGVRCDYNLHERLWIFGDFGTVVKVQLSDDCGDTFTDMTDDAWAATEVVRPVLPSVYSPSDLVAILNTAQQCWYSGDDGVTWELRGSIPFSCHCGTRDWLDDFWLYIGRVDAGGSHLRFSTSLGDNWMERSGGITPNAPITAIEIVG